jgi:hypothetical protein
MASLCEVLLDPWAPSLWLFCYPQSTAFSQVQNSCSSSSLTSLFQSAGREKERFLLSPEYRVKKLRQASDQLLIRKTLRLTAKPRWLGQPGLPSPAVTHKHCV